MAASRRRDTENTWLTSLPAASDSTWLISLPAASDTPPLKAGLTD